MARRLRLAVLPVAVLVAALISSLAPVQLAGEAQAGEASDTLVLIARGTSQRVGGSAPERFVYEVDVFDAAGDKVGTLTYDFAPTSPLTGDLVTTFHLAAGDLANHAVKAFAVDATRPDFRLIGVHSGKDTIAGEKNTGGYAGRTGRLEMSGWHGVSKFPQQVTFDDFYRIDLNRAR